MTLPLSIQLYSVREALKTDFDGTIERIAAMGYVAVEPFNGFSADPAHAAKLFQRLGLGVSSIHSPLPVGMDQDKVIEVAAMLGTKDIVCAWMPPVRYETRDSIKAVAAELNTAAANAKAHGLRFSYHNHHFEYVPMADGTIPAQALQDYVAADVLFEVDIYWAQVGGANPATVVRELAARAPLLHIKDGPARLGEPMTALGEGVIDVPGVIAAGQGHTEWLIVELDNCATDIFEALQKSYTYLIAKGFGHGRHS